MATPCDQGAKPGILPGMSKTIIVCGYGPGISQAVANRFGKEGFGVAIAARNPERLAAAAAKLEAAGVKAKALPTDLGDVTAVKKLVADARAALGPITALHYNAYTGGAGDLLKASEGELRGIYDVSVQGLVAAVQASFDDLKAAKGSVLVTGGGLCNYVPQVDAMAVDWGAMGLAIGKAAQHKTVGLLHARLAKEGIYVGEVVVNGMVKGTAFDRGDAPLDPNDIAAKLWELHDKRDVASVPFG